MGDHWEPPESLWKPLLVLSPPHFLMEESERYRNFSSVLYLNLPEHNVKGGAFYILDYSRWSLWLGPAFHFLFSYLQVAPACGAMVSYRNMNDPTRRDSKAILNHHGTFPVEAGRRYALGMWWTKTFQQRNMNVEAGHISTGFRAALRRVNQCERGTQNLGNLGGLLGHLK